MEHSEPGIISVDSELVTHTTGALPLRTDRKFTAVLDENNNPLVFSVGEDSKCYAIKVQADGRRRLIDIGSRLGISQPVHAFSVSQSNDGSLYITLASRKGDDSTAEDLHVLAPFSPKELNDAEVDLKPYLLQNKSTPRTGTDFPTDISFENIYMGPAIPPDYPLLIAAYKRPNGQTDISRVTVDLTGKTWTWKTDLDLPENAATVIDMAPGHSRLGPGLFYVYRIREEVTMLFMGTDMEANQGRVFRRKAVNFPKDAKCIAAFNDTQGNSHVLVGANGLWHYSPSALLSNRAPTLLSSDPMYDLLENLVVARANDSISVWFENQSKTLGYQQGVLDGAKCTLHDEPVPLRPEGTCAEFAPLLDPKSYSQSLVVSDLKGQMTLLEQAPDSRLWKETPFHVPSTDNNIEYLAYTTHIEMADAKGNRLPMFKTRIASSDWVTVVVNGQTLSIGKTGTDVLTDSQGVLTLIVPTDDISTFSFTLTTPGSGIIPEDQPFEIDPSVKVKTKLGSIENGETLSKARLPDGSLLLEGSDASAEDLESAAKTIKELHGMLPASGGADAPVNQPASSRAESQDKPIRGVWDFFEWVGRKAKEAWEWTVSKVKDAWHFVVKLGKQVWNFILDTAARVKKAITFVFQKIGVAFKKLAEWIGYIFNWGDIKKTQQSIVTVVKGVMGRGVSFLEAEEEKVEATFKRLKEMAVSSPIDPKVSSHEYDPKEKKSSAVTVSAPANSSAYQYEHGGVKEALQNQGNPHSERGFDKIWSEDILPTLTNIGKTISIAISDLLGIVGNSKGLTVEQILKKAVGDMIISLLDAVKTIVISVLRLGRLLITTIGKALDYDLTGIPFFGPILRKLNGGYKLTMLDIVALILAIPATIISKIVIGRPPTQIVEDDFKANETGLSDKVTRSISELGSSLQISWYIFAAVRDTIRIYTAEVGDLVPSAPGNFSLVCDLVINICTYPPRSVGPDSAYEYRRAAWLALTLNSVIKAIVWKVPAFPGKAKATVFSDAITGSIAFWLLQVVHSKEINEEYGDKDEVSTGLRIGKSVSDFIKNVAVVAGVLAIDPATKTIAVVASTGAGAAAQALESSVVSRDHEKKYYPFD